MGGTILSRLLLASLSKPKIQKLFFLKNKHDTSKLQRESAKQEGKIKCRRWVETSTKIKVPSDDLLALLSMYYLKDQNNFLKKFRFHDVIENVVA